MPVTGLNHVSVTVSDMDRALAFWRDTLGLQLIGRGTVRKRHLDEIIGLTGTEIEWAELQVPGGALIELFRYLEPPGANTPAAAPNDRGATHVCLEVTGIDELFAAVVAGRYATRSAGPVEIPEGDWRGWRDLYVESPDGVIVELSEPPRAS